MAMLAIICCVFVTNYFINVLLARWLGPDEYGDYSVAINVILLASIIFLLGRDYLLVRFLPKYIHKGHWRFARGLINRDMKGMIAVGLIMVLISALFAVILIPFLHVDFKLFEFLHPVLYFLWIIPLFGFAVYLAKLLRSLKHIYLSVVLVRFLNPVIFTILFCLFFYFYKEIGIYHVLFLYGISIMLVILFQLFFCSMLIPKQIIKTRPRYDKKVWRLEATQLLFANFLITAFFSMQIVLFEVFSHNEKQIGIYAAVLVINSFYMLIASAVAYVISPFISPLARKGNLSKQQHFVNECNIVLLVFDDCFNFSVGDFSLSVVTSFWLGL